MSEKKGILKKKFYILLGIGLLFFVASVTSLVIYPGSFLCYPFLALGGISITATFVEMQKSKITDVPIKLRVASPYVNVYEKTIFNSPLVAELKEGDEIKLGEREEANGLSWIHVLLSDGRRGYAFSEFEIYRVLSGQVESSNVIVYQEPDRNSSQIAVLPAGSKIEIPEKQWIQRYADKSPWFIAWLPNNQSGYVQKSIKIKWERPKKNK